MIRQRSIYSELSGGTPLHVTEWSSRNEDNYNLYDPECVELFLRDYWSGLKDRGSRWSLGVWIEDEDGREVFRGDAAIGDMYNE